MTQRLDASARPASEAVGVNQKRKKNARGKRHVPSLADLVFLENGRKVHQGHRVNDQVDNAGLRQSVHHIDWK